MSRNKLYSLSHYFQIPILVLIGLIIYIILILNSLSQISIVVAIIAIAFGSLSLIKETIENLKSRSFGIDYIAILAITVSLITKEYFVGIIIALMLSTGRTLEEYGASSAKRTLTELSQRIPHDILLEQNNQTEMASVTSIKVGQIIVVRKGEVIPLDGELSSENGILDESSLTGEAYPVDKIEGDLIRSGTINLGSPIKIKVTKAEEDSSYKKIVNLVQQAQKEKAPLVRLANKYSVWFTLVALAICGFTYFRIGTLESVLAVLVVATPCPLILATPIALIGGMNKSAKKRVIIKKLASIEVLSRVNTLVFDKTGTLTIGKPTVTSFEIINKKYKKEEIFSISNAIERNSLHPLAKAIVEYTDKKSSKNIHITNIREIIGQGIEGESDGEKYSLTKVENQKTPDMVIGIFQEKNLIATYILEDELKQDTKNVISKLKNIGFNIFIFTGDKLEVTKKLIEKLGIDINFKSDLKPEDKQKEIVELQKDNHVIAMIGDGINDAPALATSDVGIVFSNEEQTAASEAADIVFLGGNFNSVIDTINDSKNTIRIAKQSIFWGIGLSILGMVFASFGYIPPVAGAIFQEAIDVAVIINALRSSR